jgi:hypothetical protein
MARCQLVPVQYASDQIISGNENQLSDGKNNVGSCAIALAAAPTASISATISWITVSNGTESGPRIGI